MSLPWIPRISYGGVTFDLSLPQRPWVPISRGIGGYEESAAGIPSTWEYRRDAMRRMTIRFMEAEWGEVLAWLIHAQRGGQFGIAPDYRGDSYTCYLVAPRMGEDIEPRPGDFPGVWELDLVIRTVSGAVIPGRYYGITPLIDWSPGQMLSTMHFSRSTPAMYRDRSGVWREAAPDVPRTTWGTDPVTGLLVPRYLTEPAATNLIPGNRQKFEGWVAEGGAQVTITQGQTIPGWTPEGEATRIQVTGGTNVRKLRMPGPSSTGGPESFAITLQNIGTDPAVVDLNSSGATATVEPGTARRVEIVATGREGFWHHIWLACAAANQSLDVLAWGPQLEFTPYITSPILDPTASSSDPTVRAADDLNLELPLEITPHADIAIYARWLHRMDGAGGRSAPGVWSIARGSDYLALQINTADRLIIRQVSSDGGDVWTGSQVYPVRGDLVEALAIRRADGSGRLITRINEEPVTGASLAAVTIRQWNNQRLWIGSRGGMAPGAYGFEAFRVWSMRNGVWRGSDQELLTRARTSGMGVR